MKAQMSHACPFVVIEDSLLGAVLGTPRIVSREETFLRDEQLPKLRDPQLTDKAGSHGNQNKGSHSRGF